MHFRQKKPEDLGKPKADGIPRAKSKDASETQSAPREYSAYAGVLGYESASLPANAGPVAGILAKLQQDYGNAYVQRVVSEVSASRAGTGAKSTGGQRLDTGTKAVLESAFREDFDDIRVHTDEKAQKASEQRGARAFTRGRDVYFGKGEYDPASREGHEVLAHEMAHVAQQRKGETETASPPSQTHEREAHAAARQAASGRSAHVEHPAKPGAVQMWRRNDRAPWFQRGDSTHEGPRSLPAPAPPSVGFSFNVTPAIAKAIERIIYDPALEDQQVELYTALKEDRPHALTRGLQVFSDACRDVICQKPADMTLPNFLYDLGRVIWHYIRDPFLHAMDRRYQTDYSFRDKVDHVRRLRESKTRVPIGGELEKNQ